MSYKRSSDLPQDGGRGLCVHPAACDQLCAQECEPLKFKIRTRHTSPMRGDESPVTETILNLTLEMIYLLTGEDYFVEKKPQGDGQKTTIMDLTAPSLVPESTKEQRILEITQRIIQLLTGEVPLRCQDVTVHFSMEEWQYVEDHKASYQDAMEDMDGNQVDPGTSTNLCSDPEQSSRSRQEPGAEKNEPDPSVSPDCVGEQTGRIPQNCQAEPEAETIHLEHVEETVPDLGSASDRVEPQMSTSLCSDREERSTCRQEPGAEKREPDPSVSPGFPDCVRDCQAEPEAEMIHQAYEQEIVPVDIGSALSVKSDGLVQHYHPAFRASDDVASGASSLTWTRSLTFQDTDSSSCREIKLAESVTKRLRAEYSYNPPSKRRKGNPVPLRKDVRDMFTSWGSSLEHELDVISHLEASDQTAYQCCHCRECFSDVSEFIAHQALHKAPGGKQKQFACLDCGKCFMYKSALLRHQRIHTGEKPFICSECGKCFSQNTHLAKHRKNHII